MKTQPKRNYFSIVLELKTNQIKSIMKLELFSF